MIGGRVALIGLDHNATSPNKVISIGQDLFSLVGRDALQD